MKTNTYINELEKELSLLPKKQRDEILKEISSYINESQASYEDVTQRFGSAKDLALSYLEDNPALKVKKTSIPKLQKFFIGLSIFSIALVILAFFLFKYFTQDAFDYSKYNAKSIQNKITQNWKSLENIKNIEVHQASAVLYWSQDNVSKYSCAKEARRSKEDSLLVKQNTCYFILPKKMFLITAFQSDLTLVKPLYATDVKIEQAELRIAQNANEYEYIFKKEHSKIKSLKSVKGNIVISIDAFQAHVNKYEY